MYFYLFYKVKIQILFQVFISFSFQFAHLYSDKVLVSSDLFAVTSVTSSFFCFFKYSLSKKYFAIIINNINIASHSGPLSFPSSELSDWDASMLPLFNGSNWNFKLLPLFLFCSNLAVDLVFFSITEYIFSWKNNC